MQLLRDAFPDDPPRDMALSHALLLEVARGERPDLLRIYRPGATVAFSKLDARAAGFPAAAAAARAHGFAPLVRLGGGHAAAYGPGALVYEELAAHDAVFEGTQERYAAATARIQRALARVGVDAAAGELEGEYCAGSHSLNVGGRIKIAGLSQRVVRGAALVTTMLLLDDDPPLRPVLTDVYAALGIPWSPSTAGAIGDLGPAPTHAALTDALVAEHGGGLPPTALSPQTLAAADALAPRHVA
ncbi:lipoate--protein ligase family protein [Patulibacter defluvii]|uniref:lipoate--protein ligase family protein n=1 Tax=Patulibacter defluvii TaxID=3095358 RepID=UPI002A764CD8|nr:hypothetical protein [Patulibacter sp. DM4]